MANVILAIHISMLERFNAEAEKKLEFERFCEDFLSDFKLRSLLKRLRCRFRRGCNFEICKKDCKSFLNLYFFFSLAEAEKRGDAEMSLTQFSRTCSPGIVQLQA
jgi:hypothetical protein